MFSIVARGREREGEREREGGREGEGGGEGGRTRGEREYRS